MGESPQVAEIALSAAWHSTAVPTGLKTTDGVVLEIVHRGTWSHGLGPDFRDALILFNGRELRSGSVEIHLRTRGWIDHGHHLDAAYDTVVLHVVGRHDGSETRRQDGAIVPVAAIGPVDQYAIPEFAAWDWNSVGGSSCATCLAKTKPIELRETLYRLGDTRLAARSARVESRLATESPGEILWSELLDGLGFAMNREPMRLLARAVPLTSIEEVIHATAADSRMDVARGILLGAAGFLPLSPAEAHLGRLPNRDVAALEAHWTIRGDPWRADRLPSSAWNLVRVRPANHPVPRLVAAASILASASVQGGVLPTILGIVLDRSDPITSLRALTADRGSLAIGSDRAIEIMASGVIPLALALAAHSGDCALADAASSHWERLPAAAANAVTRRALQQVAGGAPLGAIGARGAQGLIHLDTALCQPRRCFECPVAAAELSVKG
jgi:Protein of unknown function (DUF2851)